MAEILLKFINNHYRCEINIKLSTHELESGNFSREMHMLFKDYLSFSISRQHTEKVQPTVRYVREILKNE